MSAIERFEKMLAAGKDGALLRYSLGAAYLQAERTEDAALHLARAVALDPRYSAAWKAYGRALASLGRTEEAKAAYRSGIEAADARGDVQAAKEMRVFLKRLERSAG